MPPRYAYWTIIAGGLPTAFRMTEREELLPTFRRIKQKHPDAEMKYFARGRLWSSPDEARVEAERVRAAAAERRSTRAPSRGRNWRPGGEHQDPRQKFKDAKKVRNQGRRQERFDRRHKPGAPPSDGDAPTRPAPRAPRAEWRDRPPHSRKPPAAHDRPWNDRGPRARKPPASGESPWRDRPSQDRPTQNDRGDKPYRGKPHTGGDRGPAGPRPAPKSGGAYGGPKSAWARKAASRPKPSGPPSGPGSRPARPPSRDHDQRGPAKDRRRR